MISANVWKRTAKTDKMLTIGMNKKETAALEKMLGKGTV